MSYTILLLIGSMVALGVGIRLFKVERGNETVVAARDILAICLIILAIVGAYQTETQFQYDTLGLGSSGPSVCPTTDLPNLLTMCPAKASGAINVSNSTLCTSVGTSPCFCGTVIVQCGSTTISVSGGIGTSNSIVFSPFFTKPCTGVTAPCELVSCKDPCGGTTLLTTSIPTELVELVPPNQTLCSTSICAGLHLTGINNWDNFPASLNEIFNGTLNTVNSDVYHRLTVDLTDVTGFRFGVDCASASSSVTAIFKLQYSVDLGFTWSDMGSAQNFNMATCQGPSNGGSGLGSNTYTAVPAPAQTTTTILRVVGLNGGGTGDNVLFGRVWADFQLNVAGATGYPICVPAAVPSGLLPLRSFSIRIHCAANFSGTLTVYWLAHV